MPHGRGATWSGRLRFLSNQENKYCDFIQPLTLELSDRIASDDLAQLARHPDFPRAFTRSRKLPLPALIGALLSMRNQSQQTIDAFPAALFAN